ncbi:MAG: DUF262 domain-containing protein [Hyphomicrobiaceae bacterium]|nr:MAG: DUF262 domain-containing protein [Hyphomicrobiaceae bacterium]
MPFHAKSQTLGDLFTGSSRYETPIFQRPYSWHKAQLTRLLESLFYHFERQQEGDESGAEFFLGTIVLLGPKTSGKRRFLRLHPSEGPFDIVDGQQRLATLTILLAVIRDLARSRDQADLARRLDQTIVLDQGRQDALRYRLAIGAGDNGFFVRNIQAEDATRSEINAEHLSGAEANIIFARDMISERVEEVAPEQLAELAAFIREHSYVVSITSPDIDNAYRIFSVVNQLGRALTTQDILKAELIEALPEARRERYAERWGESLAIVGGGESYETFLSVFRSAYGNGRRPIIAEIREVISQYGETETFLDRVLLPSADVYAAMVGRDVGSVVLPPAIKHCLHYLNWITHSDWKPVVSRWLLGDRGDPAARQRFVSEIERFTFGHALLGVGRNARASQYGAILSAIRASDAVPSRELALSAQEQRQILFQVATGGKKKGGKLCRQILLRMEGHLAGAPSSTGPDDLTLEHILPETLSRKSEWRNRFDDRLHQHYWRSIGNMMLVSRDVNLKGRNASFESKLKLYRGDEATRSLAINADVLSVAEWTPQAIEAREERLLDIARAMWSLQGKVDRKP